MKKVEELKAGMEVWMNFRVEESRNETYPFLIKGKNVTFPITQDCRQLLEQPPLEMFTIDENEIPELKGVEMEASYDGEDWYKDTIYCFNGEFYIGNENIYRYIRPIQKTFDLSNVPEHLLTEELKQYLR